MWSRSAHVVATGLKRRVWSEHRKVMFNQILGLREDFPQEVTYKLSFKG